jgi:YVTN family beta-propeller protein
MTRILARRLGLALAFAAVIAVGVGVLTVRAAHHRSPSTHPATTEHVTSTTLALSLVAPPGPPAVTRHLTLFATIGGRISPKSVVATNTGLVFANNMMYRHSVTVYNSAGVLLRTISDAVSLGTFGFSGHPGISRGAPVEGAVTPDGKYYWVTNYSMYGAGFGPEGSDTCTPGSARAAGTSPSYIYRINIATLRIDRVVPVGLVPKYIAVSPDGRTVIVTQWCSWNVYLINAASGVVTGIVPATGGYPRGIAVSPDSRTAYVAVMGSDVLDVINIPHASLQGEWYVGSNVRHVVIDPVSGRYLYATLNGPGDVVKVDRRTGHVVAVTHTGMDCRSLAISTDGTALFVVNYLSNSMTMLRADNLKILATVPTGTHPVGISYDGTTGRVWVAVYTGEIMVYNTTP